jgi:hypothetical protein
MVLVLEQKTAAEFAVKQEKRNQISRFSKLCR